MNNVILICGAIILIGLIIFLFLIFKAKKKHKAIKHYEELRDQLSVRELEEETGRKLFKKIKITEEEYNDYSGFDLGNIIGGFIVILVGISLYNPIIEAVKQAEINSNLLNLVLIFYVLSIVLIFISMIANSFKKGGLI